MLDSWDFTPLPRYGELTVTMSSDYKWYVSEPFQVEHDEGVIEIIPVGTQTDFASIPGPARVFFRTWGRWTRPAVAHDREYRIRRMSRKQADRRFLKGLEVEGVGWVARCTMYTAVRLGGWAAWRRNA